MKNITLCVVLLTFVVAVFGACSKDEDCFLNGVCTNGNCVCDYSWSGNNMSTTPKLLVD